MNRKRKRRLWLVLGAGLVGAGHRDGAGRSTRSSDNLVFFFTPSRSGRKAQPRRSAFRLGGLVETAAWSSARRRVDGALSS